MFVINQDMLLVKPQYQTFYFNFCFCFTDTEVSCFPPEFLCCGQIQDISFKTFGGKHEEM